ncbi:MAG: PspC domain-containing protein [Bacteroidales bacterium]|nr:PspC domain-containing protein [Bacteroidales bacterium]
MKQTEKVSIGGYPFTLESDAAVEAEAYLKQMSEYYTNPEITDGIEERMAELLRERTIEGGSVSKATILSVIDILGRPERIAEDEPESGAPDVKPSKKLYRDMANARIAGVCGGIGAYFNFDPVILRVAFLALTLVSMFSLFEVSGVASISVPMIYIILWICIPPARTARQRWELRGDDGSAESVRRNVESGKVSDALRQVGNAPVWGTVGRIFEVCIGLLLLIIAVSGLCGEAVAFFGWKWLGMEEVAGTVIADIADSFPQAAAAAGAVWFQILLLAVCALPFIGMLYASIMMLFRIKAPSWHPGLIIFILWIISIIALAVFSACFLFSAVAA